jgi:hypothetical protein
MFTEDTVIGALGTLGEASVDAVARALTPRLDRVTDANYEGAICYVIGELDRARPSYKRITQNGPWRVVNHGGRYLWTMNCGRGDIQVWYPTIEERRAPEHVRGWLMHKRAYDRFAGISTVELAHALGPVEPNKNKLALHHIGEAEYRKECEDIAAALKRRRSYSGISQEGSWHLDPDGTRRTARLTKFITEEWLRWALKPQPPGPPPPKPTKAAHLWSDLPRAPMTTAELASRLFIGKDFLESEESQQDAIGFIAGELERRRTEWPFLSQTGLWCLA